MTILNLITIYRNMIKEYGKKEADARLYALRYNKSIAMILTVCFDANGEPRILQPDGSS